MIKTRSEAGRSTGTVKRKGSLAKMTNFGYYLDDDKAFIQRCDEALANAEVSEDLAEKIKAAKEALEKEMEIEPADMRGALNRLHSPLAKDDAEKEKIFKDSRSAVFLVRKAIYDEKLNGMVNTLTSKYASNAKRTLEDGIHTIEVTKTEMEKLGITGDDVTAGLYSATTLTQSQKSKAVAEFIVKMRPQLEKAIDAVKAADAILSSDLNAILLEMKDMFDEAQKDAESLKTTVRTTVAAADKGDLEAIPLPDSLGESVQNEGILSKLAGWFSGIAGKIRSFVDSILGLTDEANDEVDHLMAVLNGVEESNKGEARAPKGSTSPKGKKIFVASYPDDARDSTFYYSLTKDLSKEDYDFADSKTCPSGKAVIAMDDEHISVMDYDAVWKEIKENWAKQKDDDAQEIDGFYFYFYGEGAECIRTEAALKKCWLKQIEDSYVNGDSDSGLCVFDLAKEEVLQGSLSAYGVDED